MCVFACATKGDGKKRRTKRGKGMTVVIVSSVFFFSQNNLCALVNGTLNDVWVREWPVWWETHFIFGWNLCFRFYSKLVTSHTPTSHISPCASPIIIRYRSIQCRSLSQSQWIRFFVSVCVAWFHDVGRISLCSNTAIWFYGLAAHCNNILMKGCRCAWNTFLFVLRVCFFCSCGSRRNKKQLAKIMSAQRKHSECARAQTRVSTTEHYASITEQKKAHETWRRHRCLSVLMRYIDGNIKSTNTNDRARQKRHRW